MEKVFYKIATLVRNIVAWCDRRRLAFEYMWNIHANRRSILVVIIFGVLTYVAYFNLVAPPREFPVSKIISIESGASIATVAAELQDQRIVRSDIALRLCIRIMGWSHVVQAGDYIFKTPRNVFEIARALSTGNFGLEPIRIRIPEGASIKDMSDIYSAVLSRFDNERFFAIAQDDEGYLYPDTYFFLPTATADIVYKAMRTNFDNKINSIAPDIAKFGQSTSSVVIMASILNGEASNTKDRRMISGVLWNRITKGMPLQVDATFVYRIGKGTAQITMSDLLSDDPYNTYKHKGLPPGPIGAPSMDSLLAAVAPIKNDFIFFLADSNGTTHYSKTYKEHLQLKAMYISR